MLGSEAKLPEDGAGRRECKGRKRRSRECWYQQQWRLVFPADTPTIEDSVVSKWEVRGVHQILSQHVPSIWQFPVVTLLTEAIQYMCYQC